MAVHEFKNFTEAMEAVISGQLSDLDYFVYDSEESGELFSTYRIETVEEGHIADCRDRHMALDVAKRLDATRVR